MARWVASLSPRNAIRYSVFAFTHGHLKFGWQEHFENLEHLQHLDGSSGRSTLRWLRARGLADASSLLRQCQMLLLRLPLSRIEVGRLNVTSSCVNRRTSDGMMNGDGNNENLGAALAYPDRHGMGMAFTREHWPLFASLYGESQKKNGSLALRIVLCCVGQENYFPRLSPSRLPNKGQCSRVKAIPIPCRSG